MGFVGIARARERVQPQALTPRHGGGPVLVDLDTDHHIHTRQRVLLRHGSRLPAPLLGDRHLNLVHEHGDTDQLVHAGREREQVGVQ